MTQWLENLGAAMAEQGAASLAELSQDKLANVEAAAADALVNPRYNKHLSRYGLPKVKSGLGLWDCVVAPCVEACAVEQDVPEYAWLIAQGEYDRALEVILARNPMPGVTGYVCTHLCQTRCTRNDYEESVAIRALKRIAEERGSADYISKQKPQTGRKVAIIGSGPSGLSAAAYLALNGVQATIFEAKDVPGGMMRAVPPFRLPWEIIQRDIDRITALGVDIKLNARITVPPEELLEQGFDAVYLASGFQRDTPLRVPGVEGPGVMPALHLLDRSRRGEVVDLGKKAVVIGGGDTAMDAVRTSQRFTGNPVTILYRRTRHEMPAAEEELEGALEEGNILEELVAPVEVLQRRRQGHRHQGDPLQAGRARPGWPPLAGRGSRQRVRRPVRYGDRGRRPTARAGVPRRQPGRPAQGRRRAGGRGDPLRRAGRRLRGRRRGDQARQHHRGVRRRPRGRRGDLRASVRTVCAAVEPARDPVASRRSSR